MNSRRRWRLALAVALVGVTGLLLPYARLYWRLYNIRTSLASSRVSHALQLAKDTANLFPKSGAVHFLTAKAARRSWESELAVEHLERASKLHWPAHQVRFEKELALVQAGDFRNLHAVQALMSSADDALAEEIYEAMARGYFATYQFGDLQKCTDFWLAWQPEAFEPRMLRGHAARLENNLTVATLEYRAALKVAADSSDARMLLAETLFRQNDFSGALNEFSKLPSEDVAAAIGTAQCRMRLGQTKRALSVLHGLLNKTSQGGLRATILHELGKAALESGRYDDSLQYLSEAAGLTPGSQSAVHDLGRSHLAAGNTQKASQFFDESQRLQREATNLSDVRAKILEMSDDADLRLQAARHCRALYRFDESIGWLKTAHQISPTHHNVLKQLVLELEEAGRKQEAETYRERLNILRGADH